MSNTIPLEEVKRIQLEILDYIDITLRKHNIEYWLDSGTLLGCIRHKGYIPWDDDIDLIVRREDYEHAIAILNDSSSVYRTLTMYNTPGYYYLFAKITDSRTHIIEKNLNEIEDLGIYIDLFPLDYLPVNDREYDHFVNKVFRLRSLIYYSLLDRERLKTYSLKKRLEAFLGKAYGTNRALRKVDEICRKMSGNQSGYLADIVGAGNKNRKIPADVFSETLMGDFEGRKYPIPKGYDTYLKALYGDYMTLPPVEQRVFAHDFRAIWVD